MGCKTLDLEGKRYGRLTVIEKSYNDEYRAWHWKCICDCGNIIYPRGDSIASGHTQSCGCLVSDRVTDLNTKHGGFGTRLYNIWQGMKKRCCKEDTSDYSRYGGRGISMCQEWMDDFKCFQEWALSHGYDDSLTIDRIDNNGNYSPDNCRWVGLLVQNNNKSSNHLITANNETHTIAEWSRMRNINPSTIYGRLKRGWSPAETLEFIPREKVLL